MSQGLIIIILYDARWQHIHIIYNEYIEQQAVREAGKLRPAPAS